MTTPNLDAIGHWWVAAYMDIYGYNMTRVPEGCQQKGCRHSESGTSEVGPRSCDGTPQPCPD